MKKNLYALLICILAAFSAQAQYHIVSCSFIVPPDSTCIGPNIYVQTNAYVSGLTLKTYFGDGLNTTSTVYPSGSTGYAYINHSYASPGTYTVKNVLYNGSSAVDSNVFASEYLYCQTFTLKCFNDLNSNCVFDSASETFMNAPFLIEVSKAGVPVDTVSMLSGIYYTVTGAAGTVFKFRILSSAPGITVSCPSTGFVYDTIHPVTNDHVVKYFAANCTGSSGAEVGIYGNILTGRHMYLSQMLVENGYCTPQNVTVTMYKSPKYGSVSGITPTPTSIVGNKITWDLTGVSLITPAHISVHYEQNPWNIVGDTIHTAFYIAPVAGDTVHGNDSVVVIDTVSGSFDPNEKSVSPSGHIHAGTKLTYTLQFENTGNDTAFNIHVMDTLSANVDVKSLQVIASSATMNLSVLPYGMQNVVKFDFPNINLLDSSHHGLCDGMVIFSINTKPGLADGTTINNQAGIYFDYNSVVMTNSVTNIIGTPEATTVMSNTSKAEIYPNPVSDELTISTGNSGFSVAEIVNTVGQVLISLPLNAAQTRINVKSLPAGIYLVMLKGKNGVTTQKFEKL
jgi:uncharacterized repeat protein (TIGR01451 family)